MKDILVYLDATEQAETRLRLAADLARRQDAHLTAIYVIDLMPPTAIVGDASGYGAGAAYGMLVDQMRQSALEAAAEVESKFRDRLRLDGLPGEWRLVEGMTGDVVALHARYFDLVVVGQADPSGEARGAGMLEEMLFSSGRPLLVVPHAGTFETVGRNVLIGWNASREATRAVHDAMPLIAKAEAATVLAVNPRQGMAGLGDVPAADIALHLARHGLKVEARHAVAPDVSDADVLLNAAADMSADLLVVGAYGHSRIRELIMGGVTRSLLQRMTLPVLMSH